MKDTNPPEEQAKLWSRVKERGWRHKQEKLENFWTGACAPKEEGSSWAQGSSLSGRPKVRATESRKLEQQGLRGQKAGKVHFSAYNSSWTVAPTRRGFGEPRVGRPTNLSLVHSPNGTEVSSCSPVMQHTNYSPVHTILVVQRVSPGIRVAWHANPASSHKTYKVQTAGLGAEREAYKHGSAHKPHGTKGESGEP